MCSYFHFRICRVVLSMVVLSMVVLSMVVLTNIQAIEVLFFIESELLGAQTSWFDLCRRRIGNMLAHNILDMYAQRAGLAHDVTSQTQTVTHKMAAVRAMFSHFSNVDL